MVSAGVSCAHKTGRKRIRILLEYNGRARFISWKYQVFIFFFRSCGVGIGTYIVYDDILYYNSRPNNKGI